MWIKTYRDDRRGINIHQPTILGYRPGALAVVNDSMIGVFFSNRITRNRNLSMAISGTDWLQVPTTYESYVRACKGISLENMALYGTVHPF